MGETFKSEAAFLKLKVNQMPVDGSDSERGSSNHPSPPGAQPAAMGFCLSVK